MAVGPVPEILPDLEAGRMVVLVDDPSRENEGDLAMLAEHATPEAVNFMAKEGRGLICMPMEGALCDRLGLRPQVEHNTSRMGTAFTNSVEAATGVTTGISAADRAHTIRVACDPEADAEALVSPGHVFPLRAKDGGVLVRGGQTEGIVDLARLAGSRTAAGVICAIRGIWSPATLWAPTAHSSHGPITAIAPKPAPGTPSIGGSAVHATPFQCARPPRPQL